MEDGLLDFIHVGLHTYIEEEEEGHYPHADRGARLPKVARGHFKGRGVQRSPSTSTES